MLEQVKRRLHYIKFTPFDQTTEQGRADERYRLVTLAILANLASRAVSMLVMVLTVSLTIKYLGTERFGVWMTIASLAGVLSFLDLGIGNALTNRIAQAASLADSIHLRNTISGGLGVLFALAVSISILLLPLSGFIPWEKIIKVHNVALYPEIKQTIHIFLMFFCAGLFTTGIQRVFHGLQRGFEVYLINIIGSCLSLAFLLVAVSYKAGLPVLLCATMGGMLIANVVLLAMLIYKSHVHIQNITQNILQEYPHLIKTGGLFFVLQIGVMIGWGMDSLLISSIVGASSVAIFNILQRLFQIISQPMQIINSPLWAAYSDALARNDLIFIQSTLKKSLIVTAGYGILSIIILTSLGQNIIWHWSAQTIMMPFSLIAIYALWSFVESLGTCLSMYLNGCNIIIPQVTLVVLMCLIALPLKIYLLSHYGLFAMLCGFAGVYILLHLGIYLGVARKQIFAPLSFIPEIKA